MIIVYDKDNCGECRKTEDLMDELGLEYETKNMSHDKEALKKVKAMGHRKAPVVVNGDDSWSGHNPEKIKALAGVTTEAPEEDDETWDF